MKQYLDMLRHVRQHGTFKSDRTGTGTYSVFGYQMRFNLAEGFPLVTTKKCHLRSIIHELLWFLAGDTNIRYLKENGVSIWDEWVLDGTHEYGDLLTFEERKKLFDKLVENKAINAQSVKDYEDRLKSDTNLQRLEDDDVATMMDFFGVPERKLVAGELGPVYGSQWRSWPTPYGETIDQISNVVNMLKTNPDSRRLIVSAWNPAQVEDMALPPCHALFQFYTRHRPWADVMSDLIEADLDGEFDELTRHMRSNFKEAPDWTEARNNASGYRHPDYYKAAYEFAEKKGLKTRYLDCQLYQRSADAGLGVPFNIASYALLTMMMAQVVNMLPGEFVWTGGDVHIYANHIEQIDLQLTREPKRMPVMVINQDVKDIFSFKYEDFDLRNYESHPHIPMPVAI